ncbi:MAG TPA: LacI family DNA-binding transcriptional regulator, partial [Chloroflexota bacterium]|nr:LacI family DNA-binding transcriptional regulator [Chloroflexota bacterium]
MGTSLRRPTQEDVARLAGVSRATVSLVLNGRTAGRVAISEKTRERVWRALRQVGYAPNAAAQMLARGRNQLLGIFTYEAEFPYEAGNLYYAFLLGIEREASRRGFNCLLFTRNRANPGGRHGGGAGIYHGDVNTLSLADGSILLGASPDRDELRRLYEERYPFVYIGRREVAGCEIEWVVNDYAAGCEAAVRHLVSLGHRKVALTGGDRKAEAYRDRLAGCR